MGTTQSVISRLEEGGGALNRGSMHQPVLSFCMASRTTVSLGDELAEQAHQLGVNVSAAARQGVRQAVRQALARLDREAYQRHPERPDDGWDEAEAWGDR